MSDGIIDMLPGEKPHEPGFYLARKPGGAAEVVRVIEDRTGEYFVLFFGTEHQSPFGKDDAAGLEWLGRVDPVLLADPH
ncbi:hypothetical protein SR39_06135 [Methylobacterium radiotolerans]|jgi:hypothetical protein|nr:hypothetical protein SR39_06135 [Methylobacterium radiotolerans]